MDYVEAVWIETLVVAPHLTPAPFLNALLNPAYTPNSNHAHAQGVRPHTTGILCDAAPASPLKVILPCPVSLEGFCICYAVNDEDWAQLMKLKVQQGNQHVEKLDHKDWQGHAGFAKLGRFPQQTQDFHIRCEDRKMGCYQR
ncbi:hypothetical protein K443DRAFT_4045 [Laccaria amethystina LaAM-08-1]|jgi:hypothetical protein|uniref:Uncharacterized protein n=1 Tax=Laccaria amethystina LaAM-08-1 TaxID=1095629 RepID=A0A0C9YAW6_9AGAR|nr:hypothetical protein K443DRAFT_4045 [Laccaria amethystina LaAM-08-1]